MRTKTSPPSIRLTIPVDVETHAIFQRLADAGREPVGRCMGRWLADTVAAAELMTSVMERARSSPKVVASELHSMMLGMVEQTKGMHEKYSQMKGPLEGEGVPLVGKGPIPTAAASQVPPSCNTGGKVPEQTKSQKGVKRSSSIGKQPLPPAKVQAYADTNGIPPKAPK